MLGHLAAEVAKWLGPLVIGSMVEAAGTVQDEPATPSSPITISIQVFVAVSLLLSNPLTEPSYFKATVSNLHDPE